ncbi:MAG: transketolase family protein [Planctomycetota bacterium]|jgi:transketolase
MRSQFRDTALELAGQDEKVVLIFGDISVYLFRDFQMRFPNRFYNAGICENTLIGLAAGLGSQGFYPFVHTIAPFVTERSFEQIKLDMCYNGFGGNIITCGASFDYAWDGATHHCYTDLAILRLLPNMEVIQPGSKKELDTLIRSQYNNGLTTYFRTAVGEHGQDFPVKFGEGIVVRDTQADVTVMTAGPILGNVIEACMDLSVNIVYFHTIKPLDRELVNRFRNTRIIVVHDAFGLHEAVCETSGVSAKYHGLPDRFFCCYGELENIRREAGLDASGIRNAVSQCINESASP